MGYALLAAVACWSLGDRLDEAMLSLVLFGFLSVPLVAWMRDASLCGELWRQTPRSLTESLTMNERRITRREHPLQFWTAIVLTALLALTFLLVSVFGVYARVMLVD
jgi:hypothetical protein